MAGFVGIAAAGHRDLTRNGPARFGAAHEAHALLVDGDRIAVAVIADHRTRLHLAAREDEHLHAGHVLLRVAVRRAVRSVVVVAAVVVATTERGLVARIIRFVATDLVTLLCMCRSGEGDRSHGERGDCEKLLHGVKLPETAE